MRLIAIGLMLGLAACDKLPNGRICTVPTPLDVRELTGPNAKPPVMIAEECIHRTAYRLARSPDDAKTVAEAVVALCREPILTQANRLAEVSPNANGARRWVDAQSVSLALGYVVQARAGKCPVPK